MTPSTIYSGPINAHAIRLKPGDDLVPAIENAAALAMSKDKSASAFILTAVGSLDGATLRMANASKDSPSNEIKEYNERMEVVSLFGTLSASGKHLHMSLSDKDGRVIGGHVVAGRVFTTLELVIGTIYNVKFQRDMDESTGYRELVVKSSDN